MRANEFIIEGGWASTATQDTIIRPQSISDLMPVLKDFETALNRELERDGIPACQVGRPVGSGTYYQRDLKQNPNKEYGDIDVQFIIPRIGDKTPAQTKSMYAESIKEFCRLNGNYETTSGVNVIFHNTPIGPIQIDMVMMFDDRVEWTAALAPEHGTKGVLSASLYSSLGEALNLSISDEGIRGKVRDGVFVPFKQRKDTVTKTISFDPKNWAVDIAHALGSTKISQRLDAFKGMKDEVRIGDIINSIKGIAETLEMNDILPAEQLINKVKSIYTNKIEEQISSSKFDKAESPAAKKKAEETKKMLQDKLEKILSLF